MTVSPATPFEPTNSAKTQGPPPDRLVPSVESEDAQAAAVQAARTLDPESRIWLEGLKATSPRRSDAVEQLHDLLLRAARHEAQRRRYLYPEIDGQELDDICRQATHDALVAVLDKLDNFRGASRFTTWAYAFVVFEISVKLRRHAWRGRSIPTADDDVTWERLADGESTAQARVESRELLGALRRAVIEELTPRQREVFVAVALNDVQIDVLAERLRSNRGAIYKVLHDARRKLRLRLEREGHMLPAEAT